MSTSSASANSSDRAKFGAFISPITPSLVLSSSIAISLPRWNERTKELFWIEYRPAQKGRNAISSLRLDSTTTTSTTMIARKEDVLPDQQWNARSRVHEYGGGSYSAMHDGSVVFEHIDGGVWKVDRDADGKWGEPKRVTQESKIDRFADFSGAHPTSPSLILAVHEDHTIDEPAKVVNDVVLIDLSSPKSSPKVVIQGADFYSSPRFSPSGQYVSWIEWNHPDMPWEGSLLHVAEIKLLSDGTGAEVDLASKILLAGKAGNGESVSQARWAAEEDRLVFLSDRTGYYELYQWEHTKKEVEMVLKEPTGADVGPPDWQFGNVTHASLSPGKWISIAESGSLRIIDLASRSSRLVKTPYEEINPGLTVISPNQVVVHASVATTPAVLAIIDLEEKKEPRVLDKESTASVDEGYISLGQPITFPAEDGTDAYAVFFPPTNKDYPKGRMDKDEKPPLLVHAHGGPTSSAQRGLNWMVQYITSRGFANVEVDYAGSSGYGKTYRQRLAGRWGLADVSDVVQCAQYLASRGLVDAKRVGITGGSAGGFTVLAALCAFPDVFTAGISHYGISDLALLAGDTHKFESQYLYALLGGTIEQVPQHYRDRSPLNNADKIRAPLLLLQGSEDKVVPPEQASQMKAVVEQNKGRCEMVMFEGEGHGFRQAQNKQRAMEEELRWLRECWGIEGGKK